LRVVVPGEQVVGHAQVGQVLGDDPVEAVGEFPCGHALRVGLYLDRGACSSVPLTMSTRLPAIRWYLANMSQGSPKPDTCPM